MVTFHTKWLSHVLDSHDKEHVNALYLFLSVHTSTWSYDLLLFKNEVTLVPLAACVWLPED